MNIVNAGLFAVIGHPVGHSLSPLMHNRAFEVTGYPGVYLAFDVTDLAGSVTGIRALAIKGVSVTIPHKIAVMDYLDQLDEHARKVGAVNTIVNQDGRLCGYNTDVDGAVQALYEKTEIKGKNVIVVGAGGAARAVGYGLLKEGARICIVNRTPEKGRRLAAELGSDFVIFEDAGKIRPDILVNTTPVGMHPDENAMPVPESWLHRGMTVMDIIYNPLQTKLLNTAEDKGCQIIDGVAMFVYQGAAQFSLWTGRQAPAAEMRRVVYTHLAAKK